MISSPSSSFAVMIERVESDSIGSQASTSSPFTRPAGRPGGDRLTGVTHTGGDAGDGDHQRLFNARIRVLALFFSLA